MKTCVYALCLALAACGRESEEAPLEAFSNDTAADQAAPEPEGQTVGQLLRAGKPEACAHPNIKARFTQEMDIDWSEVVQQNSASGLTEADVKHTLQSLGEPKVSEFSAVDSDPNVGGMLCEANLTINPHRGTAMPVRYLLRPSLENQDDYLIKWIDADPGGLRKAIVGSEAVTIALARGPTVGDLTTEELQRQYQFKNMSPSKPKFYAAVETELNRRGYCVYMTSPNVFSPEWRGCGSQNETPDRLPLP